LSSTWQLWSADNEVYVSVQGLTDKFKSSLHSSGKHRHAFVSQAQSDLHRPEGVDRAVFKWDATSGSTGTNPLLFQVLIPEPGLGTNVSVTAADDVFGLPRPKENELAILSVCKTSCSQKFQVSAAVLDTWQLPCGDTIHVLSHVDVQTEENIRTWLAFIEQNDAFADPGPSIDEKGQFDLRGELILDLGDQVGRVLDIGVREFAMWATFRRALGPPIG
jgi:hypothetical protein